MSDDTLILDEAGSIEPDGKQSKPDLDKLLLQECRSCGHGRMRIDEDDELRCPECGEPASAHY